MVALRSSLLCSPASEAVPAVNRPMVQGDVAWGGCHDHTSFAITAFTPRHGARPTQHVDDRWFDVDKLDLPPVPKWMLQPRPQEVPLRCGLEDVDAGGQRISCGIPLQQEINTGKETIMPIYHTPRLGQKSAEATAFLGGGDLTRADAPDPGKLDFSTAIVKLPRNGDEVIDKEPKETEVICGVEPGDGKIACGIPLYKDEQTGAPFILPIYRTSKDEGATSFGEGRVSRAAPSWAPPAGSEVAAGVSQASAVAEAKAKLLKVQTAAKLKEEAMNLLRRFLDAAPPTPTAHVSKSGGSALYYPAPDRTAPGGVVVVSPDVYASSAARSAGLAGWPPGQYL